MSTCLVQLVNLDDGDAPPRYFTLRPDGHERSKLADLHGDGSPTVLCGGGLGDDADLRWLLALVETKRVSELSSEELLLHGRIDSLLLFVVRYKEG